MFCLWLTGLVAYRDARKISDPLIACRYATKHVNSKELSTPLLEENTIYHRKQWTPCFSASFRAAKPADPMKVDLPVGYFGKVNMHNPRCKRAGL
ncbi:hypothetical protein VTP01DRAFT_2671 [Rhizomucor pusillus]|uniref:uncharacterized protein n=1 Tax=Rhizomucor pusillus TaxID=4840 RepID=UPI003742F8EB